MEDVQRLLDKSLGSSQGFESHPFRVGNYNGLVGPKFKLPFDEDSLAFVLISRPSMFEKTFLPFLFRKQEVEEVQDDFGLSDPLDTCLKRSVQKVLTECFSSLPCVFYHDFDLQPNRRPKLLVQTAGHVSGAVRLYRSPHLNPVCLHPTYGGWFALRGAFFFPSLLHSPSLLKEPPHLLHSSADIENLLNLYNHHWRDARYRDVIPILERYSPLQRLYFETKPSERMNLIKKLSESSWG
eukprot:TRINITY_DN7313_c0_g1_i1.p1 TRINITY_DN7313_c0_g1~~TRINITY_DN7313_c0_g1_i1.p1  ORF type:complete len:248 (-),score=53.19 TRINITY_DN7313_c0_g1_i1:842-1558(-)